ncbi:MAG: alpha/beta hydrolase [Acidobacteriaceae bacterium]
MRKAVSLAVLSLILSGVPLAQSKMRSGSAQESSRSAQNESRLLDRTFQSAALGRPMRYRILLPKRYFDSSRYYPVLYLLHGYSGDYQNWSTLTDLVKYAERVPIIIVMPDAGNSWYVDSAGVPQDKFEEYIVHDLVAEVETKWRALRSPNGRAIAGLSMGGYGAVNLALKHPDMFAVAVSLSGALNAALPELEQRADLRASLQQTFGAANSKTRAQNDVYQLAAKADPGKLPYFDIDCGNDDVTFLGPNRRFAAALTRSKIVFEYHEYPGDHNWQYWDKRLPYTLELVKRYIAPETIER